MKVFKVISHPYTVSILFSLILISGEQMGGFYLLYLLLGLPHGVLHSIIGIAGIALLILGNRRKSRIPAFIITGITLMFSSLFLFFYNDKHHYNFDTFNQIIPVATLILFTICAISCLIFQAKYRVTLS